MSSPSIKQNVYSTKPDLKDLLDLFKQNLMVDFNCHHIGTIQSFNSDEQTAQVTINYTRTFFELNPNTGSYLPTYRSYPILLDCPVIVLKGGTASLTFPIKNGDECIILFNDRSIDNWFQGSVASPVSSPRLHAFSDGIILVGLSSRPRVDQNYDQDRAVLKNGAAALGVRDDNGKVLLTNDYPTNSVTLNSLLQTLISDLQMLISLTAAITVTGVSTGGGTSGPPANAAAITAVSTSLTSVATQISGLLE